MEEDYTGMEQIITESLLQMEKQLEDWKRKQMEDIAETITGIKGGRQSLASDLLKRVVEDRGKSRRSEVEAYGEQEGQVETLLQCNSNGGARGAQELHGESKGVRKLGPVQKVWSTRFGSTVVPMEVDFGMEGLGVGCTAEEYIGDTRDRDIQSRIGRGRVGSPESMLGVYMDDVPQEGSQYHDREAPMIWDMGRQSVMERTVGPTPGMREDQDWWSQENSESPVLDMKAGTAITPSRARYKYQDWERPLPYHSTRGLVEETEGRHFPHPPTTGDRIAHDNSRAKMYSRSKCDISVHGNPTSTRKLVEETEEGAIQKSVTRWENQRPCCFPNKTKSYGPALLRVEVDQEEVRTNDRHQMKSMKPMELPKFDGSTPWIDFINQLETCKRYHNWNDEDACYELQTHCNGNALAYLAHVDVYETPLEDMSYQEMKDLLENKFGSRETVESDPERGKRGMLGQEAQWQCYVCEQDGHFPWTCPNLERNQWTREDTQRMTRASDVVVKSREQIREEENYTCIAGLFSNEEQDETRISNPEVSNEKQQESSVLYTDENVHNAEEPDDKVSDECGSEQQPVKETEPETITEQCEMGEEQCQTVMWSMAVE